MIERKIVAEKLQEYLVGEFVSETLRRVGHSKTEVVKTPVGEKIIIHASRPGLIVGSKGSNIKKLTKVLKTKFKFDNPQIDIAEIERPEVDPQLVGESIAYQLEKYGAQRFKAVGYSSMEAAMKNGALGIEILLSGKLPSARAKCWRFYLGYLKKCGDLAQSAVKTAYIQAQLKSGIIGIQVRILPSNIVLPDNVQLYSEIAEVKTDGKTPAPAPTNVTDVVAEPAVEAPSNITDGAKKQPQQQQKPRPKPAKKADGTDADKKSAPKKQRPVPKKTEKKDAQNVTGKTNEEQTS